MARYTNGAETVDAIPWTGDFDRVASFLAVNPPDLDPRVTESDPTALGVVELEDGTLAILRSSEPDGRQVVNPGDMIIRGGDRTLRASAPEAFAATFSPVQSRAGSV